jgi:uncharacterized protein
MNKYLTTFSNKIFYPEDPKPEQIDLLDIGVALSRVPRFVGHTHHFYSVAEHSILVSELSRRSKDANRIKLLALFHDASEAYVSDIPSPVKQYLKPAIKDLEDGILLAVYKHFDLKPPTVEEKAYIKKLDEQAFEIENKFLRNDAWTPILYPSNDNRVLPFMSSDQAALAFMRQYKILSIGE